MSVSEHPDNSQELRIAEIITPSGQPLSHLNEALTELIRTYWGEIFGPSDMLYLSRLRYVSGEKYASRYSMHFELQADPGDKSIRESRRLKVVLSVSDGGSIL